MYKNFASYRHYLNAKLHAMSITLSGDSTLIESLIWECLQKREPAQLPLGLTSSAENGGEWKPSVKDLTDSEAKNLYNLMIQLLSGQQQYIKETGIEGHKQTLTDRQRRAIIALTKYKLNMSPDAAFTYILDTFPEKRRRLTEWEIKHSRLTKLFSLLDKKEASKLIKRLDSFYKKKDIPKN